MNMLHEKVRISERNEQYQYPRVHSPSFCPERMLKHNRGRSIQKVKIVKLPHKPKPKKKDKMDELFEKELEYVRNLDIRDLPERKDSSVTSDSSDMNERNRAQDPDLLKMIEEPAEQFETMMEEFEELSQKFSKLKVTRLNWIDLIIDQYEELIKLIKE